MATAGRVPPPLGAASSLSARPRKRTAKRAKPDKLLEKFTGFKIAAQTEAIRVAGLREFPAHNAPPFVFLAGSGRIELSDDDAKALRWYCLDQAGMLFAESGARPHVSMATP